MRFHSFNSSGKKNEKIWILKLILRIKGPIKPNVVAQQNILQYKDNRPL